jgi:hypothetical protein
MRAIGDYLWMAGHPVLIDVQSVFEQQKICKQLKKWKSKNIDSFFAPTVWLKNQPGTIEGIRLYFWCLLFDEGGEYEHIRSPQFFFFEGE